MTAVRTTRSQTWQRQRAETDVAAQPATPLTASEPKRVLSDGEREDRRVETRVLKVLGAVAGTTAVASAALYMGPENAVTVNSPHRTGQSHI